MAKDDFQLNQKLLRFESPSKEAINTPIKDAFRASNYKIGPFLEKMNELNKIKERLNKANIRKAEGDEKENTHK